MEKQLIISVGREFGSGGHEVAQKLADDYGIALYDHDLLKEIATKKNLKSEDLEAYDELKWNRFLYRTVRGLNSSPEQNVANLQFDVLKYRLENEYNVDIRLETLPYEHIRWIANKETVKVDKIVGTSDMKKVTDLKGNPLLLFVNAWSVGMVEDRNPELVLTEFSK